MSDADHFASQDIEGTCQHNVVVFFYSLKDRFGCCALRYFKNSNCTGISAVQVKVQAAPVMAFLEALAIFAWRERMAGSAAMLSMAARSP